MLNEHRQQLAALVFCLTCFTSFDAARAQGLGSEPSGNALIVGSSSIQQSFGRLLTRALERRGYRVRRTGITSAGLARPDFRDVYKLVNRLPVNRETAVVFLYLGTNDAQSLWLQPHERALARRPWLAWSDPRWSRVYERRARRLFDRICARGAARVVAILPVDVKPARLQRRLDRIRRLQARAAAASSCAEAIRTSGDWGRFVVGGVPLRHRDGFHMTLRGAHAVWNCIRHRALPTAAKRDARRDMRATVGRMLGGPPLR